MRNIPSGYFYRVIVVVGILLLAGLVSADIWLWQRDDGSRQAAGAGQGPLEGFEAPGLPARNTTGGTEIGGVGPPSSGASASDSAELEIQRGASAPGQVEIIQIEGTGGAGSELTAGDDATVSDPVKLEDSGAGTGLTAGDGATANDSAESEVQQEQTPAPSGGPGDNASFQDSADLVVRDAAGNIKQEETVK